MANTEIRLIIFFAVKDGEALYMESTWKINTKIRLSVFFAAKDREALYNQQKQDWELTAAQIMNSLLQNSDLN